MKPYEIMALLETKMHEVFAEVQKQKGITVGDVDFEDVLELDKLTEQVAELIHRVTECQKEQ